MRFDAYTIVLLVRPPDAPALTDEEAEALQDAHLASHARLVGEGHIVAVGPLVDQDVERIRGITVMSVDRETARQIYATDPAVQAGRLAAEVMTWLVPAGTIGFERVRVPRSMAEAEGG